MLQPGDRIPEARVWAAPREGPVDLGEVLTGKGPVLLCFYVFDWSPT
jgi:peroxiredoxin